MRDLDDRKESLSAALPRIEINDHPQIRYRRISDSHSCVIVDDFLKNPYDVVSFARERASEFTMPDRSYPGRVYDLDTQPLAAVRRFFNASLRKPFSFFRTGMEMTTRLSLATLMPDELSNLQRLCHTDPRSAPGRENFAALIYLFENSELGGTAFYRWKDRKIIEQATALEMEDADAALAFLKERFAVYREPARYMTQSNDIADLLCMIPAQFNRLIFYPGDLPHSAYITSPQLLSPDPGAGRLTLNFFASVRPTGHGA